MKSKKKFLLLGVGVMGALALGVGATSTFAWYQTSSVSVKKATPDSASISTTASALAQSGFVIIPTLTNDASGAIELTDTAGNCWLINSTTHKYVDAVEGTRSATVSLSFAIYKEVTSGTTGATSVTIGGNTVYYKDAAQASDLVNAGLGGTSYTYTLTPSDRVRLVKGTTASYDADKNGVAITTDSVSISDQGVVTPGATAQKYTYTISGDAKANDTSHTAGEDATGAQTDTDSIANLSIALTW